MNKRLTVNKIFAYLLVVLLLLDGSTMWQLRGNTAFALHTVRLFVIAACFIGILASLSMKNVKINFHFIRNMLVVSILFFVFWLATRFNLLYFFRVQYLMFMSFAIYIYVQMKQGTIFDIVKAFINIWLVVAIVTTFFWLFGSVLKIIPLQPTGYFWADHYYPTYTFKNIYFANPVQATKLMGETFYRNTGIYAEAPGISSYFLYAVGLELSFMTKIKGHKFRLLTFVLTSFTTLSTKALIFIPILLFLDYVFKSYERRTAQLVKVLQVVFILFLLLGLTYYSNGIMADKSGTGSYNIRMDDISASWTVFREHPIFGVGLGNSLPIIQRFKVVRSNNGLSMGLFVLLAQGGLWMTSMYLAPLFALFKRFIFDLKYRHFIIFGVSVFLNLVISTIQAAPSFIILVAAGYAYFNLTEEEKIEMLNGGL